MSSYWEDRNGCVTRISPNGAELRSPPAQFGAITNAHAVNLDGPWSFSFEKSLDPVDSRFPSLVQELLTFESATQGASDNLSDRLIGHVVSDNLLSDLSLAIASLIVRCPGNRFREASTVEYYQRRFGFENPKADKNIVALNIRDKLNIVRRNFLGGKFVILYSDQSELIYGDGIYTNMQGEGGVGHRRTYVALTPVMGILYSRPQRYFTYPRLLTLRINLDEADWFNHLTEVYSGKEIFYRSSKPVLSDAFKTGEYRQFQYHKVDWLESFLSGVHSFRS